MSFSFQDATLLKSYEKVFIFFKTDKYQKGLVTIEKLLLHGASSFRILVMSRKKRKIDIELEKTNLYCLQKQTDCIPCNERESCR